MSAHASQAFSIAHCTDSEDLPKSDFSFLIPTSAVNATFLAFAAECRAVASTASLLVVYARRSAANLLHVTAVVA